MSRQEDWEKIHQPYELGYHTHEGVKWCSNDEQFQSFWKVIKDFIQPQGEVLDIGCGPRPPFEGSSCIEPLADEYRKITPPEWWSKRIIRSSPAETAIFPRLFDTVVIWNCLDHTASWKSVLTNALRQLHPEGRLAIGVDFRPPCIGHPGVDKQEFFEAIKDLKELKRAENFQERDLAIILQK